MWVPKIGWFYKREINKHVLEIDTKTFKEGEAKEITSWCWKCRKNVKYIATYKDGECKIKNIDCPHGIKES